MPSSRLTSFISFLIAFILAGQLWAGESKVVPLRPPVRSAPTGAGRVGVALPQPSSVAGKLREILRVLTTKPSTLPGAPPAKASDAVGAAGAPKAGGGARPKYLSLRQSVSSRLESKDPIMMDAAAFEKKGIPAGIRSGKTLPPKAPRFSFTDDELVLDLGGDAGTEAIKVQLPPTKVDDATLRGRLNDAIELLPDALKNQRNRIEKIICTEQNCSAVIGGKFVPSVPPEQTNRDRGQASTQVAMR